MRKTLALLGLTLTLFLGVLVAVPAQATPADPTPQLTRFAWVGCEPKRYDYREIGLHTNMVRFHSCLRARQTRDNLSGDWITDYLTGYGAMTCKIEVRYDTDQSAEYRFNTSGRVYPCSAQRVDGFYLDSDNTPFDDDRWSSVRSNSAGFWSKCMGGDCSAINSKWLDCHAQGLEFWHSEFFFIGVGLNRYVRANVVSAPDSYDYAC
jgi:hypothetical protein